MIGVTTIGEVLEENCCIMGKDLKELLEMVLESSEDETEKAWAAQIHEDYWVNFVRQFWMTPCRQRLMENTRNS